MRMVHGCKVEPREFRRRIERLERLPLRPTSSRILLGEIPDEVDDHGPRQLDSARRRSVLEVDPAWVSNLSSKQVLDNPLALIVVSPWWQSQSRLVGDALSHLWRHDVAVSLAARRLAREAGDRDPDAVARAALLHGIGRWAAATVDPEWIAGWLAISDAAERLALERLEIGAELQEIGHRLARRWGLNLLVVDSTWLHGDLDGGLETLGSEPDRIVLIQQAYRLAERTPWPLFGREGREHGDHEPRVKLLTAEVQARCSGPFIEFDASPREELLTRSNATLRLKVIEQATAGSARDRLLGALAHYQHSDDPEAWAEVAGLAFCGAPGVSSARVIWHDESEKTSLSERSPSEAVTEEKARPGSIRIPLESQERRMATVELWPDPERPGGLNWLDSVIPAWRGWATLVDECARLNGQWSQALRSSRRRAEGEEPRLRKSKLDALAEFAAGAGHELNNPLAVIVGRAQLLLVGESNPKVVRSLRAILTQAQRAHKILRDLMYVARPPEPRPRFCNPDEIVRSSLRDARPDAEDREIQVGFEIAEQSPRVWTDPDALRHLADSLLRNALEATPKGGQIRIVAGCDGKTLKWSIQDSGSGLTPLEEKHLFDPFFCGRQAGRGLGMGLPRVIRYLTLAGGEIRWHSLPGKGTSFKIHLPLEESPRPLELTRANVVALPESGNANPAVA